jgi:predicted O-methyltransferase YrrM
VEYYHRLVRFNADLSKCVVGKQFVFEHFGIEFCCGLAHWKGKWVFSYGYEDKACRLALCDEDAIWAYVPDATWDVVKLHSEPPPALPEPAVNLSLEKCITRASSPPVNSLPGWCTDQKARRLVELIAKEKPKTCVELGVFGGRSLLPIALALQFNGYGYVVGYDPYTKEAALEHMKEPENIMYWTRMPYAEIHRIAAKALETEGVSTFGRIEVAKSASVVGNYEDNSIDFMHQDSNHSEEISTAEVRAWLPKVKQGGLWVFDDTDWITTQTAQFLLREAGCVKEEDHRHWAVFRKTR